jgi:cytoskeletal protein RodZ
MYGSQVLCCRQKPWRQGLVMQFNRSRVFLFAPLFSSAIAIAACAAIEEPDNDTLEALREYRVSLGEGVRPTPSVSGTTTIPPVSTAPLPTGSDTSSAPVPTEQPSSTVPTGTVSEAAPLPTNTATGTTSQPVPSPSAPPVDTSAPMGSTSTPPAMSSAPPSPTMSTPMGAGGTPEPGPTPAPGDGGVVSAPNCGETFGTLAQAVIDATSILVEYITYDMNATSAPSFHVRLTNTGLMNISLKNIRIRYWLTPEHEMSDIVLDSVQMGVTGAEVVFGVTPDGTQQYLEIVYPDKTLVAQVDDPGPTDIGVRLAPVQVSGENIQNDQENDWSWDPTTQGTWGENDKLTVYRIAPDGNLGKLSGSSPCD